MTGPPLEVSWLREDRVLGLRLARPRANIVDGEMIAALSEAFARASGTPQLKSVLLGSEGSDFSFGASVAEHLPGECARMLRNLHRLLIDMAEYPVPILAAVRGNCLGGGLELALAGHLVFAASDARLGQPEIRLGVFAPAASFLLPERIGQMAAEDLLLSGRRLTADDALQRGLVACVAADPEAAALEYYDRHFAALSAASLRIAVRAARGDFADRMRARLAKMEALYLDELMATHDAVEGLNAFLEKREPAWNDA